MKRIVIGACAALLLAVLSGSEANAASPIGTTVTRLGSSIIDGQDNTWTVTPNAQIALNGQVQPITQQVELLLYFYGDTFSDTRVYQNAAGPFWWAWKGGTWVQIAGDPRVGPPCSPPFIILLGSPPSFPKTQCGERVPSENFTTVPGAAQIINGDIWTITPGRQISMNGVVQPITQQVEQLVYANGLVYQNAAGPFWWFWNAATQKWVQVAGNPLVPSPNNSSINESSEIIVDAARNIWTITPNRQIALNGTVQPITQQVESLHLLNGVVYQNAAGPFWWFWNGQSWIKVANPFPATMINTFQITPGGGFFGLAGSFITLQNGGPTLSDMSDRSVQFDTKTPYGTLTLVPSSARLITPSCPGFLVCIKGQPTFVPFVRGDVYADSNTNPTFTLERMGRATGLSFSDFGVWTSNIDIGPPLHVSSYFGGQRTPVSGLQTDMAGYNGGQYVGFLFDEQGGPLFALTPEQGGVQLLADFNKHTMSSQITSGIGSVSTSGTNTSGPISGDLFETEGGNFFGLTGYFFGPRGQEVAGTFGGDGPVFHGNDNQGVFGAKQRCCQLH
jgi:hypothetical protein